MSCWCGMDSVGTCLVCGARLCQEHALRGSDVTGSLFSHNLGVSLGDLYRGTFPISLNRVRSDLRPFLRFRAQRQAFYNGLVGSGVICWNCRVDSACRAAGAVPQPTAPTLRASGSQRLRDAVVAHLLGDAVAWDSIASSMGSDATVKDTLFQDLIHLARERAERVHLPVEWECEYQGSLGRLGEVRATEEGFHVVNVMVNVGWDTDSYESRSWYMNSYGQWASFKRYDQKRLIPSYKPKQVTVKTGWFSKSLVYRMSWSDKPPQPELLNVLAGAAEWLVPTA